MTKSVEIDLARDFSPEPFGRYLRHGQSSGERFRSQFLTPHLMHGNRVTVNIDGVSGLSSSFLDEAFAGLVRTGVVTSDSFFKMVTIISTRDPSYLEDIALYVREASSDRNR